MTPLHKHTGKLHGAMVRCHGRDSVYKNSLRAIIAIEKDSPGERVFARGVKVWEQKGLNGMAMLSQ